MELKYDKSIALLIYKLCMAFYCSRKTGSVKQNNHNEFDFVPSNEHYIKHIVDIFNKYNIGEDENILDLGCGISPILTYLDNQGYSNLNGVENQPALVRGMENILNYGHDKVIEGDMLKPSEKVIKKIKNAKVIYMYMPIASPTLYKKMVRKVFRRMSKNSLMVDFYGPVDTLEFVNNAERLDYCLYRKK